MHIPLLHTSEVRRLPIPVRDYMQKRFTLSPEYLDFLRCFEYEGVVGEKPVVRYKIFHSREARERHLDLKTINDIDKCPEIVVFEGYLDKVGNAYAADRRLPLKKGK